MKPLTTSAALVCLLALVACRHAPVEQSNKAAPPEDPAALLRVGRVTITQADLDYQMREHHGGRNDADTRQQALDELARRASITQAALEAGLDADPAGRAEMARILAARLKEVTLAPRLKAAAAATVPPARLREIYEAQADRFQTPEKRQLAVLWLNPGADPERAATYQKKLGQARDWFFNNGDVKDHPDQGFSVLSVDYSEHAASRYKGGVVGWLERDGGMDAWSKAVAQIGFSLPDPGAVSTVVARPEGLFLVRYMALNPAVCRPFEAVAGELEQSERQRLRKAAELDFDAAIQKQYPVQWLTPMNPTPPPTKS